MFHHIHWKKKDLSMQDFYLAKILSFWYDNSAQNSKRRQCFKQSIFFFLFKKFAEQSHFFSWYGVADNVDDMTTKTCFKYFLGYRLFLLLFYKDVDVVLFYMDFYMSE